MKIIDDTVDWFQWTAYFEGTALPEEHAAIEAWLDGAATRQAVAANLRTLWEARQEIPVLPHDEARFQSEVWSALGHIPVGGVADRSSPSRHGSQERRGIGSPAVFGARARLGAFATVAAIVVAAVGVWTLGIRSVGTDAHMPHRQQYHTPAGTRATVRLADGSVMTLAPATTVQVVADTAIISGQAYFTIAPQSTRAFTVTTANAVVRVLGTSFSVRHYDGERQTQVAVEQGKVAVRGVRGVIASADSVVAPQMLAQVSDSNVTVQRAVDLRPYTAWTKGQLMFQHSPLQEVVRELSRAYGVEVRLDDTTLAKQPVTVAIRVDELPLMVVLSQLAVTVDAHYTRIGKGFLLAPGHAALQDQKVQRFPQPEKFYGR